MDQLSGVIRDVRSYIFELRPSTLTPNLTESFVNMIRDFERSASMRVESAIDADLPEMREDERAMLFHIAREALTNGRKHGEPNWMRIALREHGGSVRLEGQDDGRGFDTTESQGDEHRGLRNMHARAAASGAKLIITRAPDQGTTITVDFDIPDLEGRQA